MNATCGAIGRNHRRRNPAHRLRAARVEIAHRGFVGRARERHRRRELDRHGIAARNTARLDLAVGRIQDLGRGNPLRAKREHILVARDLPAIDDEVAPIVGDDVVDHLRAVGVPRGRRTAPSAGAIERFGRRRRIDRPDAAAILRAR